VFLIGTLVASSVRTLFSLEELDILRRKDIEEDNVVMLPFLFKMYSHYMYEGRTTPCCMFGYLMFELEDQDLLGIKLA
jgi:hypothetical protein